MPITMLASMLTAAGAAGAQQPPSGVERAMPAIVYRAKPVAAPQLPPRGEGMMDLPFDLSWSTIDGGGGSMTANELSLSGTVGQHDAQTMTGGGLTLDGGLWPLPPRPACYANCNGDAAPDGSPVLDIRDFSCFQNEFALSSPYADCSADGLLDIRDFSCFQNRFALGCP